VCTIDAICFRVLYRHIQLRWGWFYVAHFGVAQHTTDRVYSVIGEEPEAPDVFGPRSSELAAHEDATEEEVDRALRNENGRR
jgi:hypothetical protein